MKFRVERDALADAVAWTAKSLPTRPSVPVLAGVLMRVADGQLTVSGFDYEVSSQVTVGVQADSDGAALVSGRLLAEITKALPAEAGRGRRRRHAPRARLRQRAVHAARPCRSRTTRRCRRCPRWPAWSTRRTFAHAVAQVAVAAGRDDTIPMLTGVRMELDGSTLSLLATDRYRAAVRELAWRPGDDAINLQALVPARTLADTAKTLGPLGGEVMVALSRGGVGEGMIGFTGGSRRTTSRLLDPTSRRSVRSSPTSTAPRRKLNVAALAEVVKSRRPRRRPDDAGAAELRARARSSSRPAAARTRGPVRRWSASSRATR